VNGSIDGRELVPSSLYCLNLEGKYNPHPKKISATTKMRGGISQSLNPHFEKLHPEICGGKIPAEQKQSKATRLVERLTRRKVKPACSLGAAGAKCAVVLASNASVRTEATCQGLAAPKILVPLAISRFLSVRIQISNTIFSNK
jgi:hypothetical protein